MTWDDGNPYVDQLADGVYAYVQPDGGWMVNNCGVAVDGSGTAILVDTTSTEKRNRAVLAEVAKVSTGAPRAVVNTHHHPDHTYGNGFLPEETLVIGHEKCREMVLAAGLEASIAGFRRAITQMQDLQPEVLAPGHGPVCRGEDVGTLLGNMDDYLAYV